jgi:hypothetical protein
VPVCDGALNLDGTLSVLNIDTDVVKVMDACVPVCNGALNLVGALSILKIDTSTVPTKPTL